MCDSIIHDELKHEKEYQCPFCNQKLMEFDNVDELCCDKQELKNIDGINTCVNCGSVIGYIFVDNYINFYDNLYKIRKKSIYCRKYHIENVINSISFDNNIELTNSQIDKIYKIFIEINNIQNKINDGRKRMINIKFIINKLFEMLESSLQ